MKTRKGMTLVEIVVALFVLSLTASFLIQNSIRQYTLTQQTKKITENLFATAKQVEKTVQDYKDAINAGAALPVYPVTVTLFGTTPDDARDVKFYPVMGYLNGVDDSAGSIYSVATDIQPPQFVVPVITNLTATLKYGAQQTDSWYVSTQTTISVDVTVDDPALMEMAKFQWYVSAPDFPIRFINPRAVGDPGALPKFPDDYVIIKTSTPPRSSFTFDDVNAYAGRHILCVVTPCSYSGKMGKPVATTPIYINGLPIVNGSLAAQYDASLIDAPADFTGNDPLAGNVSVWPDISSASGSGANADVVVAPGGSEPVITTPTFTCPGSSRTIKAQQVTFDGRSHMEPAGLAMDPAGKFTMFAVVKIPNTPTASRVIISNGSAWSFDPAAFTDTVFDPGKWYVLSLRYDQTSTMRTVNGNPSGVTTPAGSYSGGGTIMIGGAAAGDSVINLTELIIYNDALDLSDMDAVNKYLLAKYNIG